MGVLKKKGRTLAVEIDATSFKWVVFEGRGPGAEIKDIGAFPLVGSGEVVNQKIVDIVKTHKIEPENVIGCIARNQVTARNLELPSTDPREIRQMFELQAAKQTPYAVDQIISDYYVIGSSRADYSNIMLVVAHRQVVSEHVRILQEAGLKPQRVSLSTVDSVAWVSRLFRTDRGKEDPETLVVIDVDAEDTDFLVIDKGRLLFTQNISIGCEKLTKEADQWREKFLSEVVRALEMFRGTEVTKDVTQFLFTGASWALKPFFVPLQTIVGQAPRELPLPDFVSLLLEKDKADPDWLKKQSFTSVLGLACQEKESAINLVPQEVLIQSALVEKSKDVLFMGVWLILIAIVGVAFFGAGYYRREHYLEWLEQKIHATEQDASQVESTRTLIKEILRLNAAASDFFKDLIHVYNTLPREMYLTDLNLSKERSLDIRGRSDKMTSVFDFVNQLKSRPTFREVETRQLTKRIADNKEVVDFEIHCQLSAK